MTHSFIKPLFLSIVLIMAGYSYASAALSNPDIVQMDKKLIQAKRFFDNASEAEEKGNMASAERNWKKAIEVFEQIDIARYTFLKGAYTYEDFDDLYMRVREYMEEGKWNEAQKALLQLRHMVVGKHILVESQWRLAEEQIKKGVNGEAKAAKVSMSEKKKTKTLDEKELSKEDLESFRADEEKRIKQLQKEADTLYDQALASFNEADYKQSKEQFERLQVKFPSYRDSRRYLKTIEEKLASKQRKSVKEFTQVPAEQKMVYSFLNDTAVQKAVEQRKAQIQNEADRLYQAALGLYQDKDLIGAKLKFIQVEATLPNYKDTDAYLTRLDGEIQKTNVVAVVPKKREIEKKEVMQKNIEQAEINGTQTLPTVEEAISVCDDAEQAFQAAKQLFRQKRYHEAEEAFLQVQNISPCYKETVSYLKRIEKILTQQRKRLIFEKKKKAQLVDKKEEKGQRLKQKQGSKVLEKKVQKKEQLVKAAEKETFKGRVENVSQQERNKKELERQIRDEEQAIQRMDKKRKQLENTRQELEKKSLESTAQSLSRNRVGQPKMLEEILTEGTNRERLQQLQHQRKDLEDYLAMLGDQIKEQEKRLAKAKSEDIKNIEREQKRIARDLKDLEIEKRKLAKEDQKKQAAQKLAMPATAEKGRKSPVSKKEAYQPVKEDQGQKELDDLKKKIQQQEEQLALLKNEEKPEMTAGAKEITTKGVAKHGGSAREELARMKKELKEKAKEARRERLLEKEQEEKQNQIDALERKKQREDERLARKQQKEKGKQTRLEAQQKEKETKLAGTSGLVEGSQNERERKKQDRNFDSKEKELRRLVKQRQEELRAERERIRKEFMANLENLYKEALDFYRKAEFVQAKRIFVEIESLQPSFKDVRAYLNRVDKDIQLKSTKANPSQDQIRKKIVADALNAIEKGYN